MALADTARLISSLELQDKFSATAAKYERTLGSMERKSSTLDKVGYQIGRGARSTIDNLRTIGVVAAGAIAVNVAAGIRSLGELATVQNQTAAAIESTGAAANVTAEHIREQAEAMEDLTTIDDKAIQAGQNMLLTFTNIRNEVGEGNDIFDQATEAVLDLSVAMGTEPKNAALQLGKALNDPVRGLTALRRVGIQFTEQQEQQITKMVESGRTLDAQRVIIAELNKEFGGSAAAFGEGPAATMRRFGDAVEGAQQALATGFLPVMEKVSTLVQDTLSDPKVLGNIKTFGTSLAGGVEDLIDIALKLPWDAIGQSAKLMGQGAKALLDAFTGLPPWVQTAVLTGWGLNKLTGGALGNIAGTLTGAAFGKLRGSTPATPLFTKEVGLPGGGGGAPVAGGGRLGGAIGTIGKFVLGPAAAVIIGSEIAAALNEPTIGPARDFEAKQVKAVLDSNDANRIAAGLKAIEDQQNTDDLLKQTVLIASNIPFIGDALGQVGPKLEQQRQELSAKLEAMRSQSSRFASSTSNRWSQEQREAYSQLNATNSVAAKTAALASQISGVRTATDRGFSATNSQLGVSNSRLSTIASKDFSPNVNVTVNASTSVSISDIQRAASTLNVATSLSSQTRSGFSSGTP
jgi:hypothetical protein